MIEPLCIAGAAEAVNPSGVFSKIARLAAAPPVIHGGVFGIDTTKSAGNTIASFLFALAGATGASELYDLAINEAPRFQELDKNR